MPSGEAAFSAKLSFALTSGSQHLTRNAKTYHRENMFHRDGLTADDSPKNESVPILVRVTGRPSNSPPPRSAHRQSSPVWFFKTVIKLNRVEVVKGVRSKYVTGPRGHRLVSEYRHSDPHDRVTLNSARKAQRFKPDPRKFGFFVPAFSD